MNPTSKETTSTIETLMPVIPLMAFIAIYSIFVFFKSMVISVSKDFSPFQKHGVLKRL